MAGKDGDPVARKDDKVECKRDEDEHGEETDPAPNLLENFGGKADESPVRPAGRRRAQDSDGSCMQAPDDGLRLLCSCSYPRSIRRVFATTCCAALSVGAVKTGGVRGETVRGFSSPLEHANASCPRTRAAVSRTGALIRLANCENAVSCHLADKARTSRPLDATGARRGTDRHQILEAMVATFGSIDVADEHVAYEWALEGHWQPWNRPR